MTPISVPASGVTGAVWQASVTFTTSAFPHKGDSCGFYRRSWVPRKLASQELGRSQVTSSLKTKQMTLGNARTKWQACPTTPRHPNTNSPSPLGPTSPTKTFQRKLPSRPQVHMPQLESQSSHSTKNRVWRTLFENRLFCCAFKVPLTSTSSSAVSPSHSIQ